jgi:hypothetical protein
VVNNLVRSPLRPIPGPLPAKLSKLWLLAIALLGKRTLYVHSLHECYGPVMRIGRNKLSFASGYAARDIYVGVCTPAATASDAVVPPKTSASQTSDKSNTAQSH